MFCVNCGSELAEGARFCSECGARVETEHPKINYEQTGSARPTSNDRVAVKSSAPARDRDFKMEWTTDFGRAGRNADSGVSFDWSAVIDESHKKEVVDVKSPWDTTGLDDDEVDMLARALDPDRQDDTLEDEIFRDAENSQAPERSRTLTFIDILKAEREEQNRAEDERLKFKSDFGDIEKPFGKSEGYEFGFSESILSDREREHTNGYTDLKDDIIAELSREEPGARDDDVAVETGDPLDHTPDFEEQLAYIRARRDTQIDDSIPEPPRQYSEPSEFTRRSAEPVMDRPVEPVQTAPYTTSDRSLEAELADILGAGSGVKAPEAPAAPAYTEPQVEIPVAPTYTEPQVEIPVAPAYTEPQVEIPVTPAYAQPQTETPAPSATAPESIEYQKPAGDIADEYLNYEPTKRTSRFEAITDEMIAADLAGEHVDAVPVTDMPVDAPVSEPAKKPMGKETAAVDYEIAELQKRIAELMGMKEEETENISRIDDTRVEDLIDDVELDMIEKEEGFDDTVVIDASNAAPIDISDLDFDDLVGKKEDIDLRFTSTSVEIPKEWEDKYADRIETPQPEVTVETPAETTVEQTADRPSIMIEPVVTDAAASQAVPETPVVQATPEPQVSQVATEAQGVTSEADQALSIDDELMSLGFDMVEDKQEPPAESEMMFTADTTETDYVAPEATAETPAAEKAMTIEELEKDLFGDDFSGEKEEATRKIEKFFTLYKKNEEFQKLLDDEYNKLQGGEEYTKMLDVINEYDKNEEKDYSTQVMGPITTEQIRQNIEQERELTRTQMLEAEAIKAEEAKQEAAVAASSADPVATAAVSGVQAVPAAETQASSAGQHSIDIGNVAAAAAGGVAATVATATVANAEEETPEDDRRGRKGKKSRKEKKNKKEKKEKKSRSGKDKAAAPIVTEQDDYDDYYESDRGGSILTIIAIIVAILLALVLIIILVMYAAPGSSMAIAIQNLIGNIGGVGAVPDLTEWLG